MRSGTIVAAVVLTAMIGAPPALAGNVREEKCPPGRFLATGVSPATSRAAHGRAPAGLRVVLDAGCTIRLHRVRATRQGTVVRGKRRRCGVHRRVAVRGTILYGCSALTGTVRARDIARRPLEAWRSVCGDGVVDPGNDEVCDGVAGCSPETFCGVPCRCVSEAGAEPSFWLFTTVPSCADVPQGGSDAVTAGFQRLGGFAGPVLMELRGAPAGITAEPVLAAGVEREGLFFVDASHTAPVGGPTTVTVTGTAGAFVETTSLTLYVRPPDRQLDPLFGAAGLARGGGGEGTANAVALRGDGKIVAAGPVEVFLPPAAGGPQRGVMVLRLDGAGAYDGTFTPSVGLEGCCALVATGADGSVALASGGRLLRLAADGSEQAISPLPLEAAGKYAMARDGGGRLVVAGSRQGMVALARYQADGRTLDGTFGTGGVAAGSVGLAGPDVAVQSDGKVVVAGTTGMEPDQRVVVARYLANGTPEATFGAGGQTLPIPGVAGGLALTADGIVVAGTRREGGRDKVLVARYRLDGTLDGGFGAAGTVLVDFGGSTSAADIVAQPDGKVVAVGTYQGCKSAAALVRLRADGTLDPSFNGGGLVTTLGVAAVAAALQADGKILIAGSGVYSQYSAPFLVARYLP
jgi:uncharacterized delta-60 repeat protein